MPRVNTNLTVIGIDPGIADTGYGVLKKNNDGVIVLDYGSIRTPAGAPMPKRLCELYDSLTELFKRHHPTIVVIEKLFFARNVTTAMTVGQARGVALLVAEQFSCAVIELTPLQIKQGLTSYGKASKQQVQHMVKAVLKLKTIPRPDDAADALAAALCGLNTHHAR